MRGVCENKLLFDFLTGRQGGLDRKTGYLDRKTGRQEDRLLGNGTNIGGYGVSP